MSEHSASDEIAQLLFFHATYYVYNLKRTNKLQNHKQK